MCAFFEYTPGFIHAKNFQVDDRYATVGTVNMDTAVSISTLSAGV